MRQMDQGRRRAILEAVDELRQLGVAERHLAALEAGAFGPPPYCPEPPPPSRLARALAWLGSWIKGGLDRAR